MKRFDGVRTNEFLRWREKKKEAASSQRFVGQDTHTHTHALGHADLISPVAGARFTGQLARHQFTLKNSGANLWFGQKRNNHYWFIIYARALWKREGYAQLPITNKSGIM